MKGYRSSSMSRMRILRRGNYNDKGERNGDAEDLWHIWSEEDIGITRLRKGKKGNDISGRYALIGYGW